MSDLFQKLSTVRSSLKETWQDKLFLTFDIDWAHDEILTDVIEVVKKYDVSATWFVTHSTPVNEQLRSNPKFELGIHPNFNFLLEGDFRNGRNASDVVDRLLEFVPDCKSVRSHSICQSSRLTNLFQARGLEFESNDYMSFTEALDIKPWKSESGMIKVPYFFSDELTCLSSSCPAMSDLARFPGLKIFDFHPIHVYLNTESLDRYSRTRSLHQNPAELLNHRYEGYGTRNRLIDLLELTGKK